jgi:hypothetical protein
MGSSATDYIRVFLPTEGNPLRGAISLFDELGGVDGADSDLCRIMRRYGCDKGDRWHNYTKLYSVLFSAIRGKPFNLFELGLGTTNPDLPSHMGPEYKPGASLRGWREYFENATIVGADIDRDILFQDQRISTYFVDQEDSLSVTQLWNEVSVKPFQIMIDDGLHTFEANRTMLLNSINKLTSSGFYIIEDVGVTADNVSLYVDMINSIDVRGCIIQLPHDINVFDNCLAIIMQ